MVAILSGGHLEFGVGRGSQRYEYERLEGPIDDKGARFEEAMEVIRRAWTEETFAYQGTYYCFPETAVYPPPIQRPHPSIWMASTTPPTLQYAVKHRYPVMGSALLTLPRVKEYYGLYQTLLADDGHNPASALFALSRRVYSHRRKRRCGRRRSTAWPFIIAGLSRWGSQRSALKAS